MLFSNSINYLLTRFKKFKKLKINSFYIFRTRKRKHGGSSIGADESGISYKRDKEEKLEEKGKEEKGKDGKLKKKDKLEAINRRKEKYKNAPKPMDFQV